MQLQHFGYCMPAATELGSRQEGRIRALLPRDRARVTLVLYRRRAFTTKLEVRRAMWRAFDTAVRRKPLAGAADAVYGNSIDFRLEIIARSGIRQKRCY